MQRKQSVRRRDLVIRGPFLVAEEYVWSPDSVPHVVVEFDLLFALVVERFEAKPRIGPLLAEVYVERIVLRTQQTHTHTHLNIMNQWCFFTHVQ